MTDKEKMLFDLADVLHRDPALPVLNRIKAILILRMIREEILGEDLS